MYLKDYDLFLLDFDGLLVDTEKLHFEAYRRALQDFGAEFSWDMQKYLSIAQISSEHLKNRLQAEHFAISRIDWDTLYRLKKTHYLKTLQDASLTLMPGADTFLRALSKERLQSAVVTHSPKEQIHYIRSRIPELETVDHWFTRETYKNPKPAPDSYLTAVRALKPSHPIGFEDSLRGLEALLLAKIPAVLIRPLYYPPVDSSVLKNVICCVDSFHALQKAET